MTSRDIPTLLRRRGIIDQPPRPLMSRYRAAVLLDSPLFLWGLNEGSGTSAADLTGNGYTCDHGSALWTATGPIDQASSSNFGGSAGTWIGRNDAAAYDATSVACSGWMRITAASAAVLLSRENAPDGFTLNSFRAYIDPATNDIDFRRFSGSNGTTYTLPTGINVDDGDWHWFAWKYTSSAFTAAVDGVDLGSTATSGNINTGAQHMRAGCRRNAGSSDVVMTGNLAAVAYWPAPSITVADMIEHYEATFG